MKLLALLLYLSLHQVAVAATAGRPMHIMVDPGHGGTDDGASRGDLKEKDIALKVSRLLAEFLNKDPRFRATLTRSVDKKIPLPKRSQMAEEQRADIFISIHLNSSPDPKARGIEVYFQNQLPADEETLFLLSREHEKEQAEATEKSVTQKAEPASAKTDLKRILEDLKRNYRIQTSSELAKHVIETMNAKVTGRDSRRRTIRQAPFRVVANTNIPAILIELGFLSHPLEGIRLSQADHQHELASTLFEALVKFKETLDKSAGETL